MRLFGEEYRRENTALAALALFTLAVASYALLSRGGQRVDQAAFAEMMPEDYKPVVAALIRAAGNECDVVCGAAVERPVLGSQHLLATCAIAAQGVACAAPRTFELTIAPLAEPSR